MKSVLFVLTCLLLTSCATIKHKKEPVSNAHLGIVTPSPKPKEIVHPPTGHTHCYKSKPGFYNGIWSPAHKVCEYNNLPVKAVWIEPYWACPSFLRADGVCTKWEWKSAQWSKVESN